MADGAGGREVTQPPYSAEPAGAGTADECLLKADAADRGVGAADPPPPVRDRDQLPPDARAQVTTCTRGPVLRLFLVGVKPTPPLDLANGPSKPPTLGSYVLVRADNRGARSRRFNARGFCLE